MHSDQMSSSVQGTFKCVSVSQRISTSRSTVIKLPVFIILSSELSVLTGQKWGHLVCKDINLLIS